MSDDRIPYDPCLAQIDELLLRFAMMERFSGIEPRTGIEGLTHRKRKELRTWSRQFVEALGRPLTDEERMMLSIGQTAAERDKSKLDAEEKQQTLTSKAKLMRAIDGSRGVLSQIARRLGVSRTAVQSYLKKWPDAQIALEDERDKLIDVAEVKLFDMAINKDSEKSLHFLLKTQGKSRGYVEKHEQQISGAIETRAAIEWSINPMDLSTGALAELLEAMSKQAERQQE